MIKYVSGESKVKEFLGNITSGAGVFAVSSGFEHDMFPVPFVPLNEKAEKKISDIFADAAKKLGAERKAEYYASRFKKSMKKSVTQIKFEALRDYIPGEMNITEQDAESFVKGNCIVREEGKSNSAWSETNRNIINRLTGTTGLNGLFTSSAEFFKKGIMKDLYVRTDMLNKDEIKELFEVLGKYGYGADSTIGRGLFKVVNIEDVEFRKDEGATHVLSLSSYCPLKTEADLSESFYSVFVKRGKMGGDFAGGMPGSEKSFFKLPLLLIKEGALVRIREDKDVYGMFVQNVNKHDSRIIQSGFTFGPMIKYEVR